VLGFLFPWTPLLAVLRGVEWREPRIQLLLSTFVFGFVFFSASTNKLPGYVLPLTPSLAALLGIQLAASKANRWLIPASAVLLCLSPVIAGTLPEALAVGLSRAEITGYASPLSAALLVCAAAVAWLSKRTRTRAAFGLTVALTAAAILHLKWDMYPRLDRIASARPLWKNEIECIDEVHRAIRYGLNYYAGRELPDCTAARQKALN
jgi:4-amino-4-deoxy-L-arabinose transferase-like glycosyltransferase